MSGIYSNGVDYSSSVSKALGWTLDICFPSLLTSKKSDKLSWMTIVVHLQKVSMVVVALQLMCIVTANQNALYPLNNTRIGS